MNIDSTWLPFNPNCAHSGGIAWEITENIETKKSHIKVGCKRCSSRANRTVDTPTPKE